jgi:hypothetical protein
VNDWISVKDRLPENRSLLFLTHSEDIAGDKVRLIRGNNMITCFPSAVTHWMPLPEPPK